MNNANTDPTCQQINEATKNTLVPDVLGASTATISNAPIVSENTYRHNNDVAYANRLTSCLGLWWLDNNGQQCTIHIVAVNSKGEGITNQGKLTARGESTVTEVSNLVGKYPPKNDEISSFGDNQNHDPWPTFLSELSEKIDDIIPYPISNDRSDSCFKCAVANGCNPVS